MSEASDYYNTIFGPQLVAVANADPGWRSSISLVGLIPGAGNAFPGQAKAFCSLEERHRVMFLMCYFYSALLDQAIHASLREEHAAFDELAQYPKLVGILGSAYTNLHPAHLLVAVTVHMKSLSDETVRVLFDELTEFMLNEYARFFTVEYPAMTKHLQNTDDQRRAIRTVFQEVVLATTAPEPELWRHAFARGTTPAKWPLASAMIRTCNQRFKERLTEF